MVEASNVVLVEVLLLLTTLVPGLGLVAVVVGQAAGLPGDSGRPVELLFRREGSKDAVRDRRQVALSCRNERVGREMSRRSAREQNRAASRALPDGVSDWARAQVGRPLE